MTTPDCPSCGGNLTRLTIPDDDKKYQCCECGEEFDYYMDPTMCIQREEERARRRREKLKGNQNV